MIDHAGRELRAEELRAVAALRRQGRRAEARARWLKLRGDLELLAQLTPHWFRHRIATVLAHDPRAAMEQAGWRDYRSVIGYSQDVPARRRAAIAAMAAPQAEPSDASGAGNEA